MRHKPYLPSLLQSRNNRNMLIAAAIVILICVVPGTAASQTVECSIEGSRVTVTLEANPYEVVDSPDGQRLNMDGFGHLGIPGSPMLPMKRFLIALPPGARAESVEILSMETSRLPGTHQIVSSSPLVFLPGMPGLEDATVRMQDEWNAEHAAVYESDNPFPDQTVWLAGKGTYRQYAYAMVAFCPFAYHPESGTLEHHSRVEVVIHCDFPFDAAAETSAAIRPTHDDLAHGRASTLFSNYDQIADLYRTEARDPALPNEIYNYVSSRFLVLIGFHRTT